MTQKRYIKLLMAKGMSRNAARSRVRQLEFMNDVIRQENKYNKERGFKKRHTSFAYADRFHNPANMIIL